MHFSLLEVILAILLFQIISLIPFLLIHPSRKRHSNRMLAYFLMAKACCILEFLSQRLYHDGFEGLLHFLNLGSSFTLLLGPLLFLYIRSLVETNYKTDPKAAWHLVPAGMHLLFIFFAYTIQPYAVKLELVNSGPLFSLSYSKLYSSFLYLSITYYLIVCLKLTLQHQNSANKQKDKVDYSWVYTILGGFGSKLLFDMIFVIGIHNGTYPLAALICSRLLLYLTISFMIYKALSKPKILSEDSPQRNSLSNSSLETYNHKLERMMKDKGLYREPNLNIEQLSKEASIPVRSLSEVLNKSFNMSFYDYVNSHRIEEAMGLLSKKEFSDMTVLEILYEVGFNSKSSFNKAFKKQTGYTPSQYRRNQYSAEAAIQFASH